MANENSAWFFWGFYTLDKHSLSKAGKW
jgi:hypothetical protein